MYYFLLYVSVYIITRLLFCLFVYYNNSVIKFYLDVLCKTKEDAFCVTLLPILGELALIVFLLCGLIAILQVFCRNFVLCSDKIYNWLTKK